jgi:hypothetical protein
MTYCSIAPHCTRQLLPYTIRIGWAYQYLPSTSFHIRLSGGEFPDETLQLSVRALERPQALGLRDLHPPQLSSPPIQCLFRDIVQGTLLLQARSSRIGW